jgi:hypothetical protein
MTFKQYLPFTLVVVPLNTCCLGVWKSAELGHLDCLQKVIPYWTRIDRMQNGQALTHITLTADHIDCVEYL